MQDGNAITTSSTGKKSAIKDPQATLDYSFYWTDWLAEIGDSIAVLTASVVNPPDVPTPMTVTQATHFEGVATIFLSGGTLGKNHQLNCHITTNSNPPRVDERTLTIKIRER